MDQIVPRPELFCVTFKVRSVKVEDLIVDVREYVEADDFAEAEVLAERGIKRRFAGCDIELREVERGAFVRAT